MYVYMLLAPFTAHSPLANAEKKLPIY